MRKGSYLRLVGFAAFLTVPFVVTILLFGEKVGKQVGPLILALPFAALVCMALVTGSAWFAEKGGSGAYGISRKKEPTAYWITVAIYSVSALAFISLYLGR